MSLDTKQTSQQTATYASLLVNQRLANEYQSILSNKKQYQQLRNTLDTAPTKGSEDNRNILQSNTTPPT
jgi:hypothetical protein